MGEDRIQEQATVQEPEDPTLNAVAETEEQTAAEACLPPSPQDGSVGEEVSPENSEADQAVDSSTETVSAEQFQALLKEKNELYDRLLRKQAEFDNFRKRTEREKVESYDFALSSFILGLLPALDGLERGLSVTEGETVESYKKGIELILKQLRDQLASAGVQPIRATGKMFDPNFHEAVMREESTVLPENEIIEEMQRGYTFKDRLLRPSMVKVAVAPAQPQEGPTTPAESTENETGAAN
jgi:molecular chaperone GrpE